MEKDQIQRLNEIRNYLEISEEDFVKIMALAKIHQKKSIIHISDEMLYEIIEEALLNMDYDISDKRKDFYYDEFIEKLKSPEESIMKAIRTLDF